MRRVLAGMILVLAFAGTTAAGEPDQGTYNVTFGGGLNVPSKDEVDNGYVVGAGAGYHATRRLVLGAEITYLGYTGGQDSGQGSPNQSVVDYLGSGKFFLGGGKYAPYLKGVVGIYDYHYDDGPNSGADYSYSDIVYGGGAGLVVRGDKESNLYLELLARQLELETHRTRFYTFTMGVDIGFLP